MRQFLKGNSTSESSHIDQVRKSLDRFVFAPMRESERLMRRKKIAAVSCAVILLCIVAALLPKGLKAEVSTFYPSACLGGWTNLHNAEGAPESLVDTPLSQQTSALLPANTIADLYCGSFQGEVPKDVKPTNVKVTFVWGIENTVTSADVTGAPTTTDDGTIVSSNLASSTDQVINADPGTSIIFVPESTSTPPTTQETTAPADDTPVSSEPPTSPPNEPQTPIPPTPDVPPAEPQSSIHIRSIFAFENIFTHAFAQEDSSSSTANSSATDTVSVEQITESTVPPEPESSDSVSTTTASTTTEETGEAADSSKQTQSDAIFEIFYTLDGKEWKSLGTVSAANLNASTFEIPLLAESKDVWDSIAAIQFNVRRLQTLNSVEPILLDGIVLSVEHENVKEDEPIRSDNKNLLITDILPGKNTTVTTKTDSDQGIIIQVQGKSEENLVVYNTDTNEMVLTVPLSEDITEFPAYQFNITGKYVGIITKRNDACYLMDEATCSEDKNTVDQISFEIKPSANTPLEFRPHDSVPVRPQ